MPKPACDCKSPLHWNITYLSKSPSDNEVIAIEIRCSKHRLNWWWAIKEPENG